MKKPVNILSLLALALAGCLLAACANLSGPRDIELPLHKLQGSLDRRFPMTNRVLDVFDIELASPRLTVQPDTGRIALTLDARVAPVFMRQSWRGSLALSGRLFLDPARNALMMAEPGVDSFMVEGVDESRQRRYVKVANQLMQQVVVDVPLYTFRPGDLRQGGVEFVPTRITTTAHGVVVSVVPRQ